jgi:hypothetical protein
MPAPFQTKSPQAWGLSHFSLRFQPAPPKPLYPVPDNKDEYEDYADNNHNDISGLWRNFHELFLNGGEPVPYIRVTGFITPVNRFEVNMKSS